MNILFAGTPIFSAEILKHLMEDSHEIVGILTQPDRKQGRGLKLTPTAVRQVVLNKNSNIPIWQMEHFNENKVSVENLEHLKEFKIWIHEMVKQQKIDVCVVVAYGLIVPKWFLELVPCINIHASLLPRWRGAAPIHRAIEMGDEKTGVQIMKMEEGLDTGAILCGEEIMIQNNHNTLILHNDLIELSKKCISQTLNSENPHHFNDLWNNAIEQENEGVTYATKIDKVEYHLNFKEHTALQISRKIRAFYPNTFCFYEDLGIKNTENTNSNLNNNERLKILEAEILSDVDFNENKNFNDLSNGVIFCKDNTVLQIKKVQKAGGKPISWNEFYCGI